MQSWIFGIITLVSHDPSEIEYADLLLKKHLFLMLKTV